MSRWRVALLWTEFTFLIAMQLLCVATAIARRAPIVPAGQVFSCTAVRLWDGDGPIACAEGMKVRLARINTRELDGSCRPGAPCPAAGGVQAREHLAALLGGAIGRTPDGHVELRPAVLACRSDGWGKGDRTAAWCALRGVDLSEAMIRDGFAAPWRDPHPR